MKLRVCVTLVDTTLSRRVSREWCNSGKKRVTCQFEITSLSTSDTRRPLGPSHHLASVIHPLTLRFYPPLWPSHSLILHLHHSLQLSTHAAAVGHHHGSSISSPVSLRLTANSRRSRDRLFEIHGSPSGPCPSCSELELNTSRNDSLSVHEPDRSSLDGHPRPSSQLQSRGSDRSGRRRTRACRRQTRSRLE